MYPFSPKRPTHPGCHLSLSRRREHILTHLMLNSPFTKSKYILTFSLPLWSNFSELSKVLSPRLKSSFSPQIKLDLQVPQGLKKKICLPMQKKQQTWTQSLGLEDPLEVEMATHSSVLAWSIPWTEEPGGVQSTGSQRVIHDWAHTHTTLVVCVFFFF